jgi:hypothetical protein
MARIFTSILPHRFRDQGRSRPQVRVPRNFGTVAAATAAQLRGLAPYAAIELVLPGGSLIALLLWLYRRRNNAAVFPTAEILALL